MDSAKLQPIVQKVIDNSFAMVSGSWVMWSLTLRDSGDSRIDLWGNTERIIFHVILREFFCCLQILAYALLS